MPPALQRAPEATPEQERTSYAYPASGSDGGGTATPPDRLTIRLASDANNRTALHSIILVLPISILIFIEALRHPDKSIKLPIINLELEIKTILPILLLVISYMLYRALRYSRIVLWNILFLPSKVAELAFDSKEAYNVESPPYVEVFDRMFVDLSNLGSRVVETLARYTFTSFNIARSLAIYSLIFGMLVYVAVYLTNELPTVSASIHFDLSKPRWPTDPALVVDLLILGLSALLIGLAWANVAIPIIVTTLGISYVLARTIFRLIWPLYNARLFSPLRANSARLFRPTFRAAYGSVSRLRQKSRDRRFAKDQQEYNRLVAQYRQRLELFQKVKKISRPVEVICNVLGSEITQVNLTDNLFEEYEPIRASGLVDLRECVSYLKGFARYAPLDETRKRYEELKPLIEAFRFQDDDPLLRALATQNSVDSPEHAKTKMDLLTWLSAIPPKADKLRKIKEEWKLFLKSLDGEDRTLSDKSFQHLESEARSYFVRLSELASAGFNVQKPVLGSHDWRIVTYLITILGRAGGGNPNSAAHKGTGIMARGSPT